MPIHDTQINPNYLNESEIKYRTLFESASDTIIILNYQTILDCNPSSLKMFSCSRDQLIGHSPWEFIPQYQACEFISEEIIEKKAKQLQAGESLFFECSLNHTDQSIFNAELTINKFVLQGAEYFQAIIRNITERKQAQDKMKILTEELERSNRDLGHFAYVASHDLQEPLRMVTSFLQLLQRRYAGKLDKEADEFIEFAVGGASHMQQLINDLLKYSRIGTHRKNMESTDCNEVVRQAMGNVSRMILENNAIISIDHLPTIIADHIQIVQLFQNLISNAIKYHSKKRPEILIRAIDQGDNWLFSVKDNGIGIPKDHIDKVFIIFQRLHTKAQYPGTGIGLSICKRIVERHGGQIWVNSQSGQGSTFYFTFPNQK